MMVCLLLTAGYAGISANHERVNDELSEYYMEGLIEQDYSQNTVEASITSQETTQYQHVVKYEREWQGDSENQMFPAGSEKCMRLDTAIQLCDSWVESYHHGLVDVPMTMYENSTETDVLLVGGGDWIAANNLREHNVDVDQVDLDGEFMESTKNDPWLEQYHENAYEYEHLDSHQADIYTYLQTTDKQYDVILLDLPGAKSDDLLHLYSTEFYSLLESHLTDQGVVVTWAYSEYTYGEHHKAYMNTVEEAGFEHRMGYWAHSDYNNDGNTQRGERFFILSPDDNRSTIKPAAGTAYVQQYSGYYNDRQWRDTPTYTGVEKNSIFHPNYEIIIDSKAVNASS